MAKWGKDSTNCRRLSGGIGGGVSGPLQTCRPGGQGLRADQSTRAIYRGKLASVAILSEDGSQHRALPTAATQVQWNVLQCVHKNLYQQD